MTSSQSGSKKVSELFLHVKQLLDEQNNKNPQKTIRNIQNQIDGKQNQIRQLFARNLDSVTQHYLQYFEISSHQKKLQSMCEQFEKKIQKNHKLSVYDQEKIQKSQQMLQNMTNTKNFLIKYRDYIRLIKKITINLNQQKYNNAIKLYHKARHTQLQKLEKTPLVKCLPIIKTKIQQHLQKLMDIFWQSNSAKQLQLGTGCLAKIMMNQKEKVNIYQVFFGNSKNSRLSAITRNSLFRNSLIRKTSTETKNEYTVGFLKNMNEENETLQRFMVRANVQMGQLKQVKFLFEELQNDKEGGSSFANLVRSSIFKNLKKIHENSPCESEEDYKRMVCHLVGFLLVVREVTSQFNVELDQNLFVGQIYGILKKEVKSIVRTESKKVGLNKEIGSEPRQGENGLSVLRLKEYSEMFYMILGLLKIQSNPRGYTLLLQEMLKCYSEIALQKYEAMIAYQMANDNLIVYKAQSEEQEEGLKQILGLDEVAKVRKKGTQNKNRDAEHNFTGFVVFMITIYEQFYQNMLNIVRDSNCNKSLLHEKLSEVLERVISLYGSELIIKDHPLQICQGEINLNYIEKLYKYYSTKLEVEHNYSRTTESGYGEKLAQLVIELRRRMRELVEHKIELMLSSYFSEDHKAKRQTHAEYVEWLMEYVKETVSYMRHISSPFIEELLYSVVTYILFFYWQYLKELRQFSLITIYNLNLDLNFIYKFISQHLSLYHSIADKLLSLQQFYSLMLTNNVNDIVDPQRRVQSYAAIDLQILISILSKYNRVNCPGLRDLKKRDLQPIIKKLQTQIN